jgi:hypothetical protein
LEDRTGSKIGKEDKEGKEQKMGREKNRIRAGKGIES